MENRGYVGLIGGLNELGMGGAIIDTSGVAPKSTRQSGSKVSSCRIHSNLEFKKQIGTKLEGRNAIIALVYCSVAGFVFSLPS